MDLRHTHRLCVPGNLITGTVIPASPEQAHHLLHVLRLETHSKLRLFNGKDGEWLAVISAVGKRTAQLLVEEKLREQTAEPDLWLCCAVIKKAPLDMMIEKATELGVSEIQPVLTSRTQIREMNTDRAYHLCREAAEQSGRLTVPAVGEPVALTDLADVFPTDRALIVCAEYGDALSFAEVVQKPELHKFAKAAILTGPEGGFAEEELEALRKLPNAFFVRLGPRILRAETAAISALSLWQGLQGDWKLKPSA